MNVLLCQIAAVTLGGIIPGTSHAFALFTAIVPNNHMAGVISAATRGDVDARTKVSNISISVPVFRNIVTISLVRDVLAIAAVVTLACLSILTPTVAIGIGAALLVSIVLSSVAIGKAISAIKAADLWLASSVS